MGGYFGLADSSTTAPPFARVKYFIVHSPSTWATTTSPVFGSRPRSTMTRSPGMIPSPVMESPLTRSRKDASGFVTRYSSSETRSRRSSPGGVGNPACTAPTSGRAKPRRTGRRSPLRSCSRMPSLRSLRIQKWTTLFERTPSRGIISE